MIDEMIKRWGNKGREEKRVEQRLRRERSCKARKVEIENEKSGRGKKIVQRFAVVCLLSPWRNF
jgi:hypothetical protein